MKLIYTEIKNEMKKTIKKIINKINKMKQNKVT